MAASLFMNGVRSQPSQTAEETRIFRRILIRNILFPLGLGLLSSIIFVGLVLRQVSQNQQLNHTTQVVARVNHLQRLIIDSETGLRGYVITGNRKFLEPYEDALGQYSAEAHRLRSLMDDDSEQVSRLEQIGRHHSEWRLYAQKVIGRIDQKQSADAFVSQGDGKELMDRMRDIFDEMLSKEELLREEQAKTAQENVRTILFLVVFLNLFFSALIALLGRRQLFALSKRFDENLSRQLQQNEILKSDQWHKEGMAGLSDTMVGEPKLIGLSDGILNYLAKFVGLRVGTFYVFNNSKKLVRTGSYGLDLVEAERTKMLEPGEGLVGQAAKEGAVLDLNFNDEHRLHITSSILQAVPSSLLIVPIRSDGTITAVMELGFAERLPDQAKNFILSSCESIGTAVKAAKYREQLETLLREVQSQAEELQAQQEELKVSNEELEEQTRMLKDAQTRLETQAAELEQTNSQLEEQSRTLEVQAQELSERNRDLTDTKNDLEAKADELQRSSQYKSEFLANMSHELRTPLNSSLILAKLLADNKEGNLTSQQIEFAHQILRSGNDLLALINDILDLAKVEAGKLDLTPEDFSVRTLVSDLERTFMPIAKQKHLAFKTDIAGDVPREMRSDRLRVEQILRNLLSNAIKFTAKGEVTLQVRPEARGVSFAVIDSGIGIPQSQHDVIFEAFRQADGTTNRKYGGTGLGLAISRDLAKMLGGTIEVKSEVGQGSAFSLILPVRYLDHTPSKGDQKSSQNPTVAGLPESVGQEPRIFIPDDRDRIEKNDRIILIVEDDPRFANVLMDLAHEMNFKCVITDSAREGIDLAQEMNPDAVCLDIQLADQNGFTNTRHVPIHILSKQDFSQNELKPIKREELQSTLSNLEARLNQNVKNLLIVEDDQIQRRAIQNLIQNEAMKITGVAFGSEAMDALKNQKFDCVIMDLNLPDMSGFELLEKIAELAPSLPVIVYTGRDLSADEEARLKRYSQSVIVKGARSPERLLDEVTLFLHQVESKLEPGRKKSVEGLRNREQVLEGKHILIVDDDMRNIFALTSALEQKGAKVSMGRNGEEAIRRLSESGGIPDIVLMDIMMPVMDGLEATRRIRQMPDMKRLPIIALTAKAMKDDREKCFEAGANDYLSKPVDLDKLVSLIRVWVTQKQELRNDGAGALQP